MQAELPKTYRLTRQGRSLAITLLIGAIVLWITALWMLGNTLNLNLRRLPDSLYTVLDATLKGQLANEPYKGLTVNQLVPAALLLVLVIAAPLMVWNVCEEWFTRYTVTDQGLLYQTIGRIKVLYRWEAIHGIRPVDPQADEPVDELIVDRDGILQIRSRLLRTLHRLAFGRGRVPIYAGVEDRDELLARISEYSKLEAVAEQPGMRVAHRNSGA